MTAKEVINNLLEKMTNGEKISVADLGKILDTVSVKDYVAGKNAVTVFYSGETDEFIKNFSNDSGSFVRMINRTEAYRLLNDEDFEGILQYAIKCDNPNISTPELIAQVKDILYDASRYENGKWIKTDAFWARISRRFAAETKGDAYSLCGTADGDRIFAMDELPSWLENAPDDAKMGGFTKAELLSMSESERFDAVKNWTIDDMKDTKVYFDANGNKVGQSFAGTSLETKVGNVIPEEYAGERNTYDYITEKNGDVNKEESSNSDTKKETTDTTDGKETNTDPDREKNTTEDVEHKKPQDDGSGKTTDPDSGHQDTGIDSKPQDQTADGTHKGGTDGGTDLQGGEDTGGKKHIDPDTGKNGIDIGEGKVELSDKSKKFIQEFEDLTGIKADTDFTPDMVRKINKGTEFLDKIGDFADVMDAAATAVRAVKLFMEGKEDEAGTVLRDYGYSTLTSTLITVALGFLAAQAGINPALMLIMLGVFGWAGAETGEFIGDLMHDIFGLYDKAGAYTYPVDPLIFDLDGDGIETVSVKDGVNFDFDNNGFAEKIGWVGADDGLLVRDLNGNGNIDNGGELFGDLTAIADGINAVNGFEALKAFDGNGDGIIDSRDSIYAELKIWQDKNLNGMVDEGELSSLREAGIAAIGLDYSNINERDAQGNMHTQQGYYIKTDGSTAMVEDVWFDRDAADTVIAGQPEDKVFLEETEAVRKLPDIPGSGNQYSLHQAMLRDETGILQGLVEQYVQEENLLVRKVMLPQIIYVWTGAADKNPSSRGENLSDARKLEALEVVTGREFDSNYGSNPVAGAANYIEQAFDQLVELYFVQMEQQTSCAGLYGIVFQNFDVDERGNLYFGMEGLSEYLAPAKFSGII